jgi:diguanylate cyclase (GGDEF)-like protein
VRDSTQSLQDPHFKALNRRGLLLESLRKIIHSHSWVSGYAQNQRAPIRDFSVVYFDLSLFKLVNDVLGSAHGDRMIQMFLDVLSGTSEGSQGLRRDDIVARWGGDEIVLVMNASAENAELKILPLVNAFKDQMLQEFTPRIIDLYQNNPAARTKIQASILRGPVDVNGLRAMGFLHSEDSLSNPGAMLTATEKLEQGLVTLGLPRWGVGAVDLNKITQPEKQKREILEAVLKAQDEAEKKAEQMKTELIRATGASSRMQNTER